MEQPAETSSEFPSLVSDESIGPSPYQSAQFHLRQALQALTDLSPGRDPERRKAHEDVQLLLRQLLQFMHVHFSPEREATGFQRFGDLLRQHRADAGLTQRQLADYSGLSLSLIRKLEQSDTPATRSSLLGLCSVAELKLVPPEVTTLPVAREHSHRSAPNWYMSPGFDSVTMMSELNQQINGSGGSVEQTYVYLDPQSALDWISLCNSPGYVAAVREGLPYGAVATKLHELLGSAGLDLIALGPGDGKSEVRLAQKIHSECERPNMRFYLLDASQPLLSRAFKHAVDTFTDEPGIFVCGIQGNFHHLPRYAQLHYTPARSHRRRVYMILGNTIGNIENEPQFFQCAFSGAAPGDILLFDVDYAYTTSSDPDEIRRADPTLQRPVSEGIQRWLGGPIRRYCQDAQGVEFSLRLDTNRPLAGSYGGQFIATVSLPGKRTKEFCMAQSRRYETSALIRCLRGFGWDNVGVFPFNGAGTATPRGLLVFRKQYPKLKH
jgi:transcriptional regulator with XRE-family HTH domain